MRTTTLTRWLLKMWPIKSRSSYENTYGLKPSCSQGNRTASYLKICLLFLVLTSFQASCQFLPFDLTIRELNKFPCSIMRYDPQSCDNQNRPIFSFGRLNGPSPTTVLEKGSTVRFCGVAPNHYSMGKSIILIEALVADPDPNGGVVTANIANGEISTPIVSTIELYRKKVFHGSDHIWSAWVDIPCDLNVIGVRLTYKLKNAWQADRNENYRCSRKYEWAALPKAIELKSPRTKVFSRCQRGPQLFKIDNAMVGPELDTLYIIPANPDFLNVTINLNHPVPVSAFSGVLKIPKNPNDGKFYFHHDLQYSQQFLMSFGSSIIDPNGCSGLRLSRFALLSLILIEVPNYIPPPTITLHLFDCNNPTLSCKSLELPDSLILEDLVDKIVETLDTSEIRGVTFDRQRTRNLLRTRWHDRSNLADTNEVCYDDLEGGKNGCRTYELFADIDLAFNITEGSMGGPHGAGLTVDQEEDVGGTCSFLLASQEFCQLSMPPPAQFKLRCNANEPICFPCKPGWDGIRVFESFLDTEPRQAPPVRSGLHVGDLGWYYNCGEDVGGPDTHDDGTSSGMRQGRLKLEERFCVSDSLLHEIGADPRLLWVDYVKYNNNGTAVDSSFQKSPLGVFTMPSGFQQSPMEYELDKPLNESDSCTIPFAIPILDSVFIDNDSIENLIQDMVDEFNLDVDLNYGPEPPFDLEIEDFNFGLTGPTYNYQGNRTICYTNLPPEPGSCQEYNLSFTYKLRYTNPDLCYPNGGNTKVDSCRTELLTVDVCKRMYPPKPEVFIVCHKDSVLSEQEVCLNEPIEQNSMYRWELINGDSTGGQVNYFTFGNCMDSLTFSDIEDHSFTSSSSPRFLNFLVSSVAQNGRESVQAPITIIVNEITSSPILSSHGLLKPVTVSSSDYDVYPTYCSNPNPEPNTYWDLSLDSSSANQEFQTTIDLLNQTGFVSVSNISDIEWTPDSYVEYQGLTRVCYGHLPDGDPTATDDKSIVYNGYFTPKVGVCFSGNVIVNMGIEQLTELSSDYGYDEYTGAICDTIESCPVQLMSQKVYKLQAINSQDPCPSDPSQIINGYAGTNPQSCNYANAFSACEGDTTLIGYNGPIIGSIDSVKWFVPYPILANSLSNLTDLNPYWFYPNNPSFGPGSTLLYKCLIYYQNTLLQTDSIVHCEYIHLCGTCSSMVNVNNPYDKVEIDRIVTDYDGFESTIYPNPFTKSFVFQSNQITSHEVTYSIYSLDGKLVSSGRSKRNEEDFLIDCSNCTNGVYLLIIDSPKEGLKMTLRIDSLDK